MDVEGMDEVIGKLEEIRTSLSAESRCEWASRIEKRAREICGDKDEKHIRFHCDEKQEIMLTTDRRGKDCLLRAIKELHGSMPPTVQAFFRSTTKTLKK